MKPSNVLTRRKTLAGLAAVAGIAATSGAGALPAAAPGGDLTRVLSQRARTEARRIGRAYLAVRPYEADAEALLKRILGEDAAARQAFLDLPRFLQRERIAHQVRGDFAAGRTVVVSNWVLAETEARLAALVEMLFR